MRALVRTGFGVEVREVATLAGGAGAVHDGTAYVLVEEDPHRRVGSTLGWAYAHGAETTALLTPDRIGARVASRRIAALGAAASVWTIVDTDLERVEPAPPHRVAAVGEAAALGPLIEAAGAEVVVDHGVLRGEVLGLEVARAEPTPEGWQLAVGVGRHDQEAAALLHGAQPPEETLRAAVATVRRHRRPDAPHHPLGRLAPERWLRALVCERPALVGADALGPVETPDEPATVEGTGVAIARGEASGSPIVVACGVGMRLELVPVAADARACYAPEGELVVVVPERDLHPMVARLAALLPPPARVHLVPSEWRAV